MSDKPLKALPNLWAKEASPNQVVRPFCKCLSATPKYPKLQIHTEEQDTNCLGWHRLNELIEEAAQDSREVFSPVREMEPEQWVQITILPPTIAKLKSVKHLILYGSSLVRIPPEIGEMESLENFTPYTSYRLHWFPYEILRCKKLIDSTISTRALYGNYKHRPPFPQLPQIHPSYFPKGCSVCNGVLDITAVRQVWISLRIGTDVVPLLVHACSDQCIVNLPTPPDSYIPIPHTGGSMLQQPAAHW